MERTTERTVTEVAAALLSDGEKLLICQRPSGKNCGLLWEFAGGKVEPGENGPQALVRECREELGVEVAVGRVFADTVYAYANITVHITLYCASIVRGTPQRLEHHDLRWVTVSELERYDFCPADEVFLQKIALSAGKAQFVK